MSSANVLKMIQRIRAKPKAFMKYRHNQHLVAALNRFAKKDCDVPLGWTAKTDKTGRVSSDTIVCCHVRMCMHCMCMHCMCMH